MVTNRHDTQNDDIRAPYEETESTSKKNGAQSALESSYGKVYDSELRLMNKSQNVDLPMKKGGLIKQKLLYQKFVSRNFINKSAIAVTKQNRKYQNQIE